MATANPESIHPPMSADSLDRIRHEASGPMRTVIPESSIGLRTMLADLLAEHDRLAFQLNRAAQLRDQSTNICTNRTIELESIRSILANTAMERETGGALLGLLEQLRRLRRVDCVTRRFDWTALGMQLQVQSELDELDAVAVGSEAAKGEAMDVVSSALQLAMTHGVEVHSGLLAATAKLKRRIDHVETGGTWAGAKALEVDAK
jgi:hypothetical protein